ncbi:MAG: hypothetical protein A2033_10130 [Bacteroidetes bacterium GWA2_31_9]|nr:MAG: hypothetical protein A2033_10130 [Bacteroidetes bacterium GWA2_31_9]
MKNIFTILAFIVACNIYLHAQTSVPGGTVSGNWTVTSSPYLVQGSLLIQTGQTLTIDPGVEIVFQGQYQLYVQGRILALGNETDSIIFNASNTASGWAGIRFDNTPTTNDTSQFLFCKILYAKNSNLFSTGKGGGIYINNFPKVSISHCSFRNCSSSSAGGGIYSNSTLSISYSHFSGNSTSGEGGAIYLQCTSGAKIINSVFSYNTCSGKGGGVSIAGVVMTGCNVNNNTSTSWGGGICYGNNVNLTTNSVVYNSSNQASGGGINGENAGSSSICSGNIIAYNQGGAGGGICGSGLILQNEIHHNTCSSGGGVALGHGGTLNKNNIYNNTCTQKGGGIWSWGNQTTITNNQIYNNTSNLDGGGICYRGEGVLTDNLIANNTSVSGGGLYLQSGYTNISILNNTIVNNATQNGGCFYAEDNNSPEFKNCVIWGNTASSNGQQFYLSTQYCQPIFYNCDIQGGSTSFFTNGNFYIGTYQNNIDVNPLFTSPTTGSGSLFDASTADFSLQNSSPCINSGDSVTYPTTDIAGNPRVVGCIIDMGAYENQTIPAYIPTVSASGTTTFCQGDSVVLTSSFITGNLWSNGDTTQSITVKTGGTYYNGTCSETGNAITVTVIPAPTIIISTGGNTSFCQGDSVVLIANDANVQYIKFESYYSSDNGQVNVYEIEAYQNGVNIALNKQGYANSYESGDWQSNGKNAVDGNSGSRWSSQRNDPGPDTINPHFIVIDLGQVYYDLDSIRIKLSNWYQTFSVLKSVNNTDWVKIGSGLNITGVSTYNVIGSGIGISYLWNNLDTTQSIIATQSGSYFVLATNIFGCFSTSSTTSVTVNSIPATPVISVSSFVLTSNSSTGNQWYNSAGIINGANSQNYTATSDNTYYVIVTENGCSSAQSNSIIVLGTNIEQSISASNGFVIYPNPVKNELYIKTNNLASSQKFEIVNNIGQVVYNSTVNQSTVVDMSALPSGVYSIKMFVGNEAVCKRFVKE